MALKDISGHWLDCGASPIVDDTGANNLTNTSISENGACLASGGDYNGSTSKATRTDAAATAALKFGAGDFTVACVIKNNAATGNFISKFGLSIVAGWRVFTNGTTLIGSVYDGTNNPNPQSSATITDNTCHLIGMRYQASTGRADLMIDAGQDGTNTVAGTGNIDTDGAFNLGCFNDGNGFVTANISKAMVWKGTYLSNAEWTTLYNGGTYLTYAQILATGGPTLSSVTPSSGNNNQTVSITNLAGTNFTGTSPTVLLKNGGTTLATATSVVQVSSIKVTCSMPCTGVAPGTYDIYYSDSGGNATLSSSFTVNEVVPAPTSMSPATITTFAATAVTITGTGFLDATTAFLSRSGYSNVTLTGITVVNDTTITATAPAGTAIGVWTVNVTDPAGTGSWSSPGVTVTGRGSAMFLFGVK